MPNTPFIIERISEFNFRVVKIGDRPLSALATSEARWLAGALHEEAEELGEAGGALVEQVDACGDAIIFAIGGLVRMGLTPVQINWVLHLIMDANFEKKAGVKAGRTGAPDAVKPEGWAGPEARIRSYLNV